MTTALATQPTGSFLAGMDQMYGALADAASEMGGSNGGMYLKFSGNDGIFTYGSAGDELAIGTQVAFNPSSLQRGWICWKDEEVVDEKMSSFMTGSPVNKNDLEDHGPYDNKDDGWQEQSIVDFKMVEAPFHDLIFKATGIGKRNAVARLVQDFVKSYKANPGLVPIVEIDEDSYVSKAKGARGAVKHAPKFKIVAWVPESELAALQEGNEADYEGDDEAAGYDAEPEVAALPAPEPEPAPAPAARPARAARAAPAPAAAAPAAPAATAPAAAPARRGRF